MDVMSWIIEKALVLIPALWVLGLVMKNTQRIPDWIIPSVLTALGVVGGVLLVGADVNGVLQGILCAGAAVLADQTVKQITIKRVSDENK